MELASETRATLLSVSPTRDHTTYTNCRHVKYARFAMIVCSKVQFYTPGSSKIIRVFLPKLFKFSPIEQPISIRLNHLIAPFDDIRR